jgi:hypothetical protein
MAPIWYGFYGKAEVVSRRRPAISIGVIPNNDAWTAIARRNDCNTQPRCANRIEQVQRELREIRSSEGLNRAFKGVQQTNEGNPSTAKAY